MPQQFEEDPRPLRGAGAAREEDFPRQKPTRARSGLRRRHRRVADEGQRPHRPTKNIAGDVEILDGIAPGGRGDVGQPPLVPQCLDVGRRIEHGAAEGFRRRDAPKPVGQGSEEGIDLPCGGQRRARDHGGMAPLVEPIEDLREGRLLVVVIQPVEHRHGAVKQLLPDILRDGGHHPNFFLD